MSYDDTTMPDRMPRAAPARGGGVIGRRSALQRVEHGLTRGSGFVQIVGPPGVGKSRLLEAARRDLDPDAVVSADFAKRPQGPEIVERLDEAFDAETRRGPDSRSPSPVSRLAERLERHRIQLLALDLPYGLAADSAFFERLRERAPSVDIVLASQHRQRIVCPTDLVRLDGLSTDAGIELLRRRVAVTSGATADFGTPTELEELVDRLDGLPIALEAAAERSAAMAASDLLERWDRETTWLFDETTGADDSRLVDRLADAWQYLTAEEKRHLRRLSIATTSFRADLVDTLRPDDEAQTSPFAILEQLVHKSWLLRRTSAGHTEFYLPEILRRFAARRRRRDTDVSGRALESRYAVYVRDRLDQWHRQLEEGRAEAVHRDVRDRAEAFLEAGRATTTAAPETALDLLVKFGRFQAFLPRSRVYRRALEEALEAADASVDPDLRVRAMARLVIVYQRDDERDPARRRASRAVELANDADASDRAMAEALVASSLPLLEVDREAALHRLEEARQLTTDDSPRLRTRIAVRHGFARFRTFDLEGARTDFRRARRTSRAATDPALHADLSTGLGYVLFRLHRLQASFAAFEEAVEFEQIVGRPERLAGAHFNLGTALLAADRLPRARRELDRARSLWSEHDHPGNEALAATRLGVLLAEREQFDRARRILRRAVRLTHRRADAHNRASAEGLLGLVDLLDPDEAPSTGVFRDAIRDLVVWRDPALAAVFRTAADLRAVSPPAGSGPVEARELPVSLGGLLSLLAPRDYRLNGLVAALARLRVRAFERLAPDHIRDEWRQVVDAADRRLPDESLEPISAPARLLSRAVRDQFDGSDQTREFGPPDDQATHILWVHPHGHWFRVDDQSPVDLMSRGPMRRMLGAIVQQTAEPNGHGLSVEDLIEIGWPDQTPTPESGANRVYNTIRRLRQKGLEDIVVTGDDGYIIDTSVAVHLADQPPDA